MYLWSRFMSQISLFLFVCEIFTENEMTPNENRLFGRHFEMENVFRYFFFKYYGCF